MFLFLFSEKFWCLTNESDKNNSQKFVRNLERESRVVSQAGLEFRPVSG